VNPYGVALVPRGFPEGGPLSFGDIVVSNFNNSANLQGTGTTIVSISPNGTQTLFFQGSIGLGLSTALGVLRAGFVIVGNVPSVNGAGTCTQVGTEETGVEQGSLIILDRHGRMVKTLTSEQFLNGPWDLTIRDNGDTAAVFVSNVLSGTVTRIDLAVDDDDVRVIGKAQIASGYLHRCDVNAFVIGPTGLALQPQSDTLYVASTGDNTIFKIKNASTRSSDAGQGTAFVSDPVHMHGPLGLGLAPNGDLLATQGDAINPDPAHFSEITEFSPAGQFIGQFQIDPAVGSAFGLAIVPLNDGFRFAAVDDGNNILDVWNVR
jgi:DNA-binding beta-propeller fold protein YncE